MGQDSNNSEHLPRRAAAGDQPALAALWGRHGARPRPMVRLRLDRRLQRRVVPSDVLGRLRDLLEHVPGFFDEG